MAFGLENSLPLSVSITGNKSLKVLSPYTSYRYEKISVTDFEVFASRRNASIKLESTKCIVNKHFPPLLPITESICTTAVSGLSSKNFSNSS